MRRWLIVPLLLLALVWVAGCGTVRTRPTAPEDQTEEGQTTPAPGPTVPGQPPAAVEPVTPRPILPPIPEIAATAAPWTGTPAQLYDAAQQMFIHGVELTQAEKFEEALAVYQSIMRLMLRPFNRQVDPETTRKIDSLYYEVCLAQVRLARLTGRFAPVIIKRKLIGIDFTPDVERWIRYYTLNGRETMQQYLSRSTRYLPMIRQILKDEALPDDLAYLPLIESGYSSYAYSPAAAVGMWQFIRDTGTKYGLKINEWVDERRDPTKSTRAAAHLLKDLYTEFGDWALALAAYNCGEGCVSGAIANAGHRDYWRLSLPAETMAYVPKYFASVMVARDPETFGLFVAPENPLDIKQVELKGVVELKKFAELVDVSYEELKAINPEILGSYSPPGVDVYKLNVPADDYDDIVETIGEMSPSDLYLTPEQVASLERPPMPRGRGAGRIIYYRVRRGDTIASVARRYHTNSSMIRELNPQLGGGALKPGTTIKVPVGGSRRASGHHRHRRH